MIRVWAGATASFFVGLLGFSGVFAEGIGSTVTPNSGSRPPAAFVLADANFSSRSRPTSFLERSSEFGTVKSNDAAAASASIAFVDFAYASPFGAAWSPINSMTSATSPRALRLADAQASVDSYFGAIESASKRSQRASSATMAPMGINSVDWR
jgi:hypothetical protein